MSFKLHIFTHDQDNVQIPSIVSIIVYNMYLEASEMCVWGVTTSLMLLCLSGQVLVQIAANSIHPLSVY